MATTLTRRSGIQASVPADCTGFAVSLSTSVRDEWYQSFPVEGFLLLLAFLLTTSLVYASASKYNGVAIRLPGSL